MTALLRRIETWRTNGVLGQLARFGISGGIATLLYAVVYSPLAGFGITSEQVANICGYLVAMVSGYLLHSQWSFRGHGAAPTQTSWRFFLVSLVSYAMNAFWVWLLTDDTMLAGPWWWPLIPVLFVTPLVTFVLNRIWVFG